MRLASHLGGQEYVTTSPYTTILLASNTILPSDGATLVFQTSD